MRVLVTRPQPQAGATARAVEALGHRAILSPLSEIAAVAWEPPTGPVDAVAFTSAHGAACAGDNAAAYRALPAYTVGEATAAAARAAGFADVRAGDRDAAALFGAIGAARVLHLAGRDHVAPPPGVMIRVVYEARLAERFTDIALAALTGGEVDVALLYSARTAARFAALCADAAVDRSRIEIAAIGAAALVAAGGGWRRAALAAEPTERAIFAAGGLSCEKRA